MMQVFHGKKISSLVAVVPRNETSFDDEWRNYGLTENKAKKYKEAMGFDRHRIAPPDVTSSDLCATGLRHLLEAGKLAKEDIGALLFISQTPDYFLPPTANVLQGRFGLGEDVFCLDINQGCAGFVVGLMQALLLLDLPAMKKVVLLTGDTASKQVSPRNRASYPLLGDGGSVAVVERDASAGRICLDVRMDGSRHEALIVPAGAYRCMSTPETLVEREDASGILRSQQQIQMDGPGIFSFTMEDVLRQVRDTLAFSGDTVDTIDSFLFHQPNRFVLNSMADKLGVARNKMPSNITGIYGNCSSVSIPLNIVHNCREGLLRGSRHVCVSGFGVGLVWATMVLDLGPLSCCAIIEH